MSGLTYNKQPLSIPQQIQRLKERGMIIDDEQQASVLLSHVSYYRLRNYTSPFQDNTEGSEHHYLRNDIHLSDVIDMHQFDERLKVLLYNALGKVELAVRTTISQVYAEANNDGHWFLDEVLFDEKFFTEKTYTDIDGSEKTFIPFDEMMSDFKKDVYRSKEEFIEEYRKKYTSPSLPPSWMSMEVISFGVLSRMFQMLETSERKEQVAKNFGVNDVKIFTNWLHAFSFLRNCCAHHNRVWNRRMNVLIIMPYCKTTHPFMPKNDSKSIRQNKLFAVLSALKYIMDVIQPGNTFNQDVRELIKQMPKLVTLQEMGFPERWQQLPIWQIK